MMILEILNNIPCIAAGIPIISISFVQTHSIFILSNLTCKAPSSLYRILKSNKELVASAIVVAKATPATSNLNTITNTKFNTTLIVPEIIKQQSGLLVSPPALSMADSKLQMVKKNIPMKHTLKQSTARGSTSVGVDISFSSGRAMISPIIETIKPVIIDNTSAVCMA